MNGLDRISEGSSLRALTLNLSLGPLERIFRDTRALGVLGFLKGLGIRVVAFGVFAKQDHGTLQIHGDYERIRLERFRV